MRILVIHGPNLNILGWREPEKYGTQTLEEIDRRLVELGRELGAEVECFQSNWEGAILEKIHQARGSFDAIVINPGGLTHHGGAVRDALVAVGLPAVEVHMTHIWARQQEYGPFLLLHEMIAPVCAGQITGFGAFSYELGLRAAVELVRARRRSPGGS